MSFTYREAVLDDSTKIVEVTNDAFMADCFFKKEEYHLRFTLDDVQSMIRSENSCFLVAHPVDCPHDIVGSIYLHWDIEKEDTSDVLVVRGKFSAVSVPSKHGRKGLGRGLVRAAEEKVRTVAHHLYLSLPQPLPLPRQVKLFLEMGVINLREDLFPWYEAQGFHVIGDIHPNDPEVERITLNEFKEKLWCILMRKELTSITS